MEDQGLIGVINHPKLLVPGSEISCKIVQRLRVSRWAKCECFPVENNGLVQIMKLSKLLVPRGVIHCTSRQTSNSHYHHLDVNVMSSGVY